MDSNFPQSLMHVLQYEGGWSDNPKDPGGATMKGVTIATYRRYINKNGTKADLRKITDEQLRTVYKRQYWDAAGCDRLPVGLDFAVFDFAVNSGPGKAKQYLKAPFAIDAYCDARLAYMKRIKGGALWKTFGKGWARRVADVRAVAGAMVVTRPTPLLAIEPKPAPAPVPVTDKEQIKRVQADLTALNYNPGGIDGLIGPLTAGAIRVFRADNGMPEGDFVDDDLILALKKAAPRKMVAARANATGSQIAAVVPEANAHWWNKWIGGGAGGGLGAAALVDAIAPTKGYMDQIRDLFTDVPGYVFLGVGAVLLLVVAYLALHGQKKADEAYRAGDRR